MDLIKALIVFDPGPCSWSVYRLVTAGYAYFLQTFKPKLRPPSTLIMYSFFMKDVCNKGWTQNVSSTL